MATEVSDLNVIQDEDTLRKMWQQTEDFGRKKEIRLRMYRLREERLKSYYITRETTNSTVTDHKTSTSSHAESLSDQGFLTMKTKEIRDSASPTLDLKQSSQLAQICSSNDKVDANANVADRRYRQTSRIEDLTNSNSNSYSRHESSQQREYENTSFQKTSQNTTSALEREPSSFDFEYDSRKLEKNVVVDVEAVNMAAETERRNVREDSKTQITNRSSRDSYDSKTTTTTRSPSSAQYETVITSSCEQQGTENSVQPKLDVVRESWSSRNATVNAVGSPSSAQYETVTASTFEQRNENSFQPIDGTRSVVVDDSVRETSRRSDSRNDYSSSRHESKTTNATEITTRTDSASNVDALTNVDKSIMNELHKLDSYLLKEANAAAAAAVSPAPSSPRPQTPNQEPKTQGDYATTYQQAYGNNNNNNNNNCNKISQDVSVTHNAFASSLRASPTPSGKRSSSERSSPEKTPRASPEKHAATYAFRRENVRNRHRASTSECDSDDSSATYNKKIDRKLTVAKRVETTTKTTRHHQKQQQRENQFSSEGSVERETKKYAKSPNSSPERSSAFRPVNVVAAAASSTQRFHAETRRQSFPQTPTAASSDEKPKHRVHADERSYSEKIDVRRSPIKSPKPASAVTRTDHKIPQRAVSAAKMADKTEYTASYTSPARDRSPQKTPYDYASIRPQPQSRTPPSSTAAPANETFVSSKKIEPTYRVAAVPTVSQTASSPVASGRESDAATTTAARNAIRKSATSPPKTERASKKTVAKPKEDESQSESSETDSSTEDSDVEESQVTIEDVTESGPTTATATATTLDDFIESDDDILKQNAKLVDEFDLIKEEKTTPLDATTKAGGVEEFLRQERIVKEGEIDGSIPPAEVVLGKEAAKLLKDSSFVSKERDQAGKSANRKAKETVTQKKASSDAAKSVPAVNAKSPGTEKWLVKRSIPTADCATPNKSNNVAFPNERVVEKQIAPRKQTPNESSKPSTLGKSATVAVESRPRKNNSTRNTFDDSARKKSQTDGKTNVAVTTKIRAAVKKIDSKVTLKESVNLPEEGLRGREKVVAAKSNETKILKKYKSDKDVYKKQSDKKYRRTESDKPLRTDATKTSSTLRTQNPTSSRSLRGYEKPTQSSRNGTRYSETAKENIYRENSSKNVVADKVCKTARTGPPASSSSSSPNTSTPGYAKARKTTTTRTQTDGNVVTKSTATAAPVTPKKSAPSSNNRARKDTPKPQQITINVSDRPSFRPRAVASPSISVSKDKLKKGAPAKSAIFETTSSSSSSELDLVDVEARDGEDAQEANAEIVDVAEKVAKGDGETPLRASSDSQHLNVIVRMPSSSRETTPKLNDEQFCTVVEDGGSPRYADRVIEPEDAETVRRIVIPRFEKITDLDENDEEDEASHNVSVADRVSKFLENTKEADVKQANLATDQVFQNQTVNQTKEIFESIAKGTIKSTSTSSPSPQQQQPPPPIANRPSVFEHKRLSESIKEEEDETAHGHGHDGPHKIVSKKLTDRDYDDYVAEHLSEVGQVDQRTESATHSNFTNKEKLESEKKEVAGSAKIAQKACDEADRGTVQTPRKPKSPTRVQPKSAHSNTLSAADHRRYEHTSEVGQHVVEQTSNKSTSATPRVKLDSRDSPVPAPSKVRTQSRETSPTKGGDANKKCNVVGKTTVQRYESRKFSDKLSPKPIEMTTIEVRPSKHVYDHTAITTVDACDKYSYKTNSVKQETRKSPSPSSKQKSPSPVRVAPTNKKSERLVSTTSATDYENRKQFFENKERADRQKSSKHYQNDTAATVSRKRCGSGKTSSPEKESSFDATTAGERRSPEKTRPAAPFGVSLKKTNVNATTTSSSSHRKTTNSDALTDDEKKVEEIFDLQLLEAMLEKAARYDLRSRIRAQIRLVRRQMELKTKKSSRTPSPEKSPAKDEIKRISSHQHKTTVNEVTQVAIDRRDKVKKQLFTEDKLDGKTKQQTIAGDDFIKSAANSSKKHVSGVKCKSPVDENDGETTTTYRRSFGTTTTGATVRNTSRNNVEARSTTDRIISGYGVGPTDEQGKPLFGLKALRTSNDADDKSSTREDHASKTVVKRRESQEITDRSGKPLFGLKALQRSAQRSENYVTTTSSHAHHHSTNRSSDDKFGSSSTSSSTVYSSRTAMKSDNNGNLSILRDEVKGEIHSKNGQLPTGTMTRNQIAYEKPLNKEATVRTSSSTRILNGEKEREHSSRTQRQRFDTGDDHLDSKCKSVSSALPSVDDDGWKSKFNTSSSLIRRISNEHFEKAQRKFNATTSTDENRRDSIEKEHEKLTSARHSNTERNERKTQLERDNSLREIKSKFQQATVSSSMKQVTRLADDGNDNHNHNGQDKQSCENRCEHFDQRLKHASLFNQRHSEYSENQAFSITANHDATQRVSANATGMGGGQLADEEIQTACLANKFVGGSISLQGLKVISSADSNSFSTSVGKFENQNKTNQNLGELNVDQISDEEELRNLLEACTDYEKRRVIRAKLRNIMADRKGYTESMQSAENVNATADTNANATHTNESTEVAETSSTSITTTKNETFSSSIQVHSKTSSTGRIVKANSVTSPFAKFRQLERQNSFPSSGAPIFKFTDPKLTRSASSIKDRLLNWVKAQTKDYKNVQIDNFSTSWNNGLAFCALIHHFCPHAFDYNKLMPEQRRYNFELAFRVAEQEAGIVPLLDVEDMVIMKRPDWKCVFTYVQSVYQRFHASPEANRP